MKSVIKKTFVIVLLLVNIGWCSAQQKGSSLVFGKEDSLRGSMNVRRSWWDVTRYDIEVTPDYVNKTISGVNAISYVTVKDSRSLAMQIDLQSPLSIDSVVVDGSSRPQFEKEG